MTINKIIKMRTIEIRVITLLFEQCGCAFFIKQNTNQVFVTMPFTIMLCLTLQC